MFYIYMWHIYIYTYSYKETNVYAIDTDLGRYRYILLASKAWWNTELVKERRVREEGEKQFVGNIALLFFSGKVNSKFLELKRKKIM